MSINISFNVPYLNGKEGAHFQEALTNQHFSGIEPFAARVETFLQKELA